ncbi:MAG: DUF2834 domain-containing protein [bacterium]|nr:DUF2834 domain-containing protein [bacterium]
MKNTYLFAAIIGAIVPGLFFFGFIQENGVDLPAFMSALFVNGAAGGFSADLFISSFVFWAFMFQQQKRAEGPSPFLFMALNLCIGLSCALPAYLYVREKV